MIQDITLGQYFPIKSPLHKLDARAKILLLICNIVFIFTSRSYAAYACCVCFCLFVMALSRVPFKTYVSGLKPLWVILIFTAVLNLFFTAGTAVHVGEYNLHITYEGIDVSVKMILRLVMLIMISNVLTFTTSPITLTDGIEKLLSPAAKIGFPSHELAMMMSIAIRFIPTLLEETDKIMKAQKARGADFENGNFFTRAKALIPMLVPLFISAFRRADDLALAMESRCYKGGQNRTHLKELHFTAKDAVACLIFACYGVCLTVFNIFF